MRTFRLSHPQEMETEVVRRMTRSIRLKASGLFNLSLPVCGPRRMPAPLDHPSGLPPVPPGGPGVYPIHAASGVGYGEGFAGNAHHHAPDAWLAAVKFLV